MASTRFTHAAELSDRRHTLQAQAIRAVRRAVHRGDLPPSYEYDCVDCGLRPANNYDHRDYRKPLEVEPVCGPCNFKRPPAAPFAPAAAWDCTKTARCRFCTFKLATLFPYGIPFCTPSMEWRPQLALRQYEAAKYLCMYCHGPQWRHGGSCPTRAEQKGLVLQ